MPRFPLLSATLLVCLLAAPTLAAERAVSPPPFGPAHARQSPGHIAWNGDQGFIIWTDWRAGSRTLGYGARIDAAGNLLDPAGIPFAAGPEAETLALRVIRAGDAWIVFWTDGAAIYAQRIGTDGSLLGDAVTIETSLHPEVRLPWTASLGVGTNGESIIVSTGGSYYPSRTTMMSSDLRTRTPIAIEGGPAAVLVIDDEYIIVTADRVFRVSADGEVQSSHPSPFTDPPACPSCGRLGRAFAWTGTDYLMAWKSGRTVFGRRLARDLTTVGEVFEIAEVESNVVVSVIGGGAGAASVILRRDDNSGVFDYQRVAISAGGEIAAPQRFASTRLTIGTLHEAPSGYVFLQPNLTLQWLNHDFETLRTTHLAIESFARQQNLSAVRDGMADLVVFGQTNGERTTDYGDITRALIGRPGGIAQSIGETARPQDLPSIASNGRNALAAWLEKAPTDDIRVMIRPFAIDDEPVAASARDVGRAAISWNARGGVLGLSDYQFGPRVVWSGHMYLVFWKGLDGVYVARVLEDGTVLGEPSHLELLGWPHTLAATRVAEVTLLVWSYGGCGGIPCGNPRSSVFAARLAADGQPIDGKPIAISEGAYAFRPDVAASGSTALIVWEEEGEVLGRRMTSGGYLFEPDPFRIGPSLAFEPTVAKHHGGFFVAWQDAPALAVGYPATVLGTIVSAAGEVSSPAVLAHHTWQPEGPFAWSTPSGAAAVAFSRASRETGFTPRLLYRVIGEPTPQRTRAVRR